MLTNYRPSDGGGGGNGGGGADCVLKGGGEQKSESASGSDVLSRRCFTMRALMQLFKRFHDKESREWIKTKGAAGTQSLKLLYPTIKRVE